MIGFSGFTACVCCEHFELPRVNAPALASNQPIASLRGSQREMRTSAMVTVTVFLMQLTKKRATDSESGWEWGKG